MFGAWFRSANQGGKTLDQWTKKGEGFGHLLSDFSVLILKGVNALLKFGQQVMIAFEDITLEDFIDGVKDVAEALKGVLGLLVEVGDAAIRAGEASIAVGTIGKDTKEMTKREMLASAGFLGGAEARSELAERFQLLEKQRKVGMWGQAEGETAAATERHMIERSYELVSAGTSPFLLKSKLAGLEGAEREEYLRERGMDIPGIEEMKEDIKKMTAATERSLKEGKTFILKIGEQEFARVTQDVFQQDYEQGMSDTGMLDKPPGDLGLPEYGPWK
jgi:hypothetical protein